MSAALRCVLRAAAVTVALLLAVAAGVAAMVVHALRPAAGEWATRVHAGPFAFDASVPALWRIASHPMVLRAAAGRTWHTPFGPLRWAASPTAGEWFAECAPCAVSRPEWGAERVTVSRVAVTFRHTFEDRAVGRVVVGDAPHAVAGDWTFALRRDGATLDLRFADVPIAEAYATLAAVVPEVRHARIDGRFDLRATLQLPSRSLQVVPVVRGFRVAGLGTEALANARPDCAPASSAGFGRWLPRAVLAAEDQRFHEHAGIDLAELAAAWSTNQARGAVVRGGSTLPQQLAKLVYTGEGRSPARKLRELLYAVELDRTLGKARVLQLYLAMAPWGDGLCGAAAAARTYLHKDVAALTPIEAAWLASLLHNPDRDHARFVRDGRIDTARVAWVLGQMRPAPPARSRVPAAAWRPPS